MLFHKGKEITGERSNVLITDGLPSYHNAFYWEFYTNTRPQSQHINTIKLDGDMTITRWRGQTERLGIGKR
ncbi:hypothetical protein MNV_670013 [Candidatus Methanoperedens nitroreducens]|uniref:Uncharacterized protein n=1 Tax=Candidatus Methanoperedens nitratireducens TaxID=1392998 RepID=A0A284VSY9_9EURY|nr:hypothetical protein MNV_670013 [Candidatus Methanoperedens nitroreducens]